MADLPGTGTSEGKYISIGLTEHSYQWLWGQRQAVHLLSSFCCLPWRGLWSHQWQQVSTDTWSTVCLLFPSGDSSCLRRSWSLTLLSPLCTALSSYPYSPRQRIQSNNALTWVCAEACVLCACVWCCHSTCVLLCVGLSVSFHSAVQYTLGFMVRIQALIPIMQTIKNVRRTVFYNLILK